MDDCVLNSDMPVKAAIVTCALEESVGLALTVTATTALLFYGLYSYCTQTEAEDCDHSSSLRP